MSTLCKLPKNLEIAGTRRISLKIGYYSYWNTDEDFLDDLYKLHHEFVHRFNDLHGIDEAFLKEIKHADKAFQEFLKRHKDDAELWPLEKKARSENPTWQEYIHLPAPNEAKINSLYSLMRHIIRGEMQRSDIYCSSVTCLIDCMLQ